LSAASQSSIPYRVQQSESPLQRLKLPVLLRLPHWSKAHHPQAQNSKHTKARNQPFGLGLLAVRLAHWAQSKPQIAKHRKPPHKAKAAAVKG
jgi:hypothetical protein